MRAAYSEIEHVYETESREPVLSRSVGLLGTARPFSAFLLAGTLYAVAGRRRGGMR